MVSLSRRLKNFSALPVLGLNIFLTVACGSETAIVPTTSATAPSSTTTVAATSAPPIQAVTATAAVVTTQAATSAPASVPTTSATSVPDTRLTVPATTVAADQVAVVTLNAFHSNNLNNDRRIDLFLPPGYATSAAKYKVLYMNDGQDVYSYDMKNLLQKQYEANQLEKFIVVAIYNTPARLSEYGTAGTPNSKGMGDKAQAYSQFVLDEVMPYLKQNYRVLDGPANTVIMGSSLGGLMAFDLAWKHSDVFGKVGVFSGSFWWRADDSSPGAMQSSRIMHKIVRESPKREGLKMWFEAGTEDEMSDRDGNGVIDAIQDTTELMDELKAKGYQPNTDMVYLQVEGGKHSQLTWVKVLPDFLKWAFPSKP